MTVQVRTRFLSCRGALDAWWRYDPRRPLEVVLRLRCEPYVRCVDWVFSRQLLSAAFMGTAGEGDVSLRADGRTLTVALFSPDGHALLTGSADVAWGFLMATFESCLPCAGLACLGREFCQECAAVDAALDVELAEIEEAMW